MKRWIKWGGVIFFIGLAAMAIWGYSLTPEVHFNQRNHPILAVPADSPPGSGFIDWNESLPFSLGRDFVGTSLVNYLRWKQGPDSEFQGMSSFDTMDYGLSGWYALRSGQYEPVFLTEADGWIPYGDKVEESLVNGQTFRQTGKGRSGGAEDGSSFNVLILGVDAREGENSRSDVILLAHVDPKEKEVHMLSIPRDTRVYLDGIGYTKINHAHFIGSVRKGNSGGTEAAIQAVSNLLKVPVNYYVKIDFAGFESFIDSIGGVELDLPQEVWLTQPLIPREPLLLPAGPQTLNGELALDYVRERYSREDGEFGRQAAQMEVIRSVAAKLTQLDYLPKLPGLIQKVKEEVLDTNFTDSDLLSLAWLFKNLRQDQLMYRQISGRSGRALDPLVRQELYYWLPDKNELEELAETYLQ